MAKKLNVADVKKWFLDRGSELLSEYRGVDYKIKFRCSSCKKIEKYCNFYNIRKLNNKCLCKKCNPNLGRKPLSQEEVENYFEKHNSKLLSKYKKNIGRLEFLCSKCGGKGFYSGFEVLKKFNSNCLCRSCTRKNLRDKLRVPEKEVINWFLLKGSKLESEYILSKDKIKFRCTSCSGVGEYNSFNNLKLSNGKCLCKQCSFESRSGKNHYHWNSDLTEAERQKRRVSQDWYYWWDKKIRERYNYTCLISGKRGGYLEIHHLYNWRDFPEQRIFIENGVLLKREIHKEFHNRYGYRNNIPEQFIEFMEDYHGD